MKRKTTTTPHVLVVLDKCEGTASRRRDGNDLLQMWAEYLDSPEGHLMDYQVAVHALDVGDVWICLDDTAPFEVPVEKSLLAYLGRGGNAATTGQPTLEDVLGDGPSLSPPVLDLTKPPSSSWTPPKATIVVERKSVSDLQSSISGGRYRDQKTRLTNCDAEWVIYLVENYKGSRFTSDPVLKQQLLSAFVHTMFRDRMPVYHTPSIRDSFEWLQHLASEAAKGKLSHAPDYLKRTKYTDNIKMNRKSNLTATRGLELQLATIPQMSAKKARAVVGKYNNMMELCRAYEGIADVQERETLLSDITFVGPSGKPRRLGKCSRDIYRFVSGGAECAANEPS